MDDFGRSTHDPDPMHIDPDWAAMHSPFGGTIAFGFWTLAMLTAFQHELSGGTDGGFYPDIGHDRLLGVNYGCDRLRFLEPVLIGARIRCHGLLNEVKKIRPDRLRRTTDLTVEIEGRDRPALTTRWIGVVILRDAETVLSGFRNAAG